MRGAILVLPLLVAACASGPAPEMRVDFMFRTTGAAEPQIVSLASPPLVNEINGAFTLTDTGLYARAVLGDGGRVSPGVNRVFLLDFIDHGDISILRTDDKRLSLRAELGPGGLVVRALLGAVDGQPAEGFTSFENDRFESGAWSLLYDGPDLVVGRLDLKFRKHVVSGNFRAPKLR